MLRKLHHRKKLIVTILIGSFGTILLVVAGVALKDYYSVTQSGPDYPSTDTVNETTTISEKPIIVSNSGYIVPANQPRTIQIPALDAEGYIQRVGVNRDGSMSTPNNIHFAGWYTKNPAPGADGLSIINGHAGGKYTEGIFRHLADLKTNDSIRIQMGDLSWRKFSVVSIKTYAVELTIDPLFAHNPSIQSELHLITCDGIFNDTSQSYDQRTIVVAKYVQ